jgi:hypothetical protein
VAFAWVWPESARLDVQNAPSASALILPSCVGPWQRRCCAWAGPHSPRLEVSCAKLCWGEGHQAPASGSVLLICQRAPLACGSQERQAAPPPVL